MSCALVDGTALPQLQPQDYLLLHQAAAANDLEAVCVRTSRPLAPAEAVEQWYAMLYDPQVSRHAAQEIGQLNATAAAASSTRTPSVGAPVLRGHGVAFSLQTDCSIGRSTADNKVDVDVSAQPDAFKVTPRCSVLLPISDVQLIYVTFCASADVCMCGQASFSGHRVLLVLSYMST
jgi:hypothetical protein